MYAGHILHISRGYASKYKKLLFSLLIRVFR